MDDFVDVLRKAKVNPPSNSLLGDNRATISDSDISSTKLQELQAKSDMLKLKVAEKASKQGSMIHLVLVDGFILYDEPRVFNELDVKIFLFGNYETLLGRREARSGYVTLEGYWVDPPGYFQNYVWPAYLEFNDKILSLLRKSSVETCARLEDSTSLKNILAINSQNMDIGQMVDQALDYIDAQI
jgi:uridine kinase